MEEDANLSGDIPPDKLRDSVCVGVDLPVVYSPSIANRGTTNNTPGELYTHGTSNVSFSNDTHKELTIKKRNSNAKHLLKTGCNDSKCNTSSNDALVCGECSANVHYECSRLPGYQIHTFLTAKNYRKFVCETCCGEIPTTCCKNDCDKVLVKEMECSVLQESNEKLHKSLRHVIEEKDHVISQQDMVITSLKEDAIVSKNATITEKDNIISQQNDVSSTLRNDYESETIESESEEDSEGSSSEYEDSKNLKTDNKWNNK